MYIWKEIVSHHKTCNLRDIKNAIIIKSNTCLIIFSVSYYYLLVILCVCLTSLERYHDRDKLHW